MRNSSTAYAERVGRIIMRNSCAAYAPELQRICGTRVPHMRNWCGAYAKHVGHTSVFSCFSRFRQPKPIYLLWVIIVVYFSPSEIRLQQSDIDL